MAKGRYRSCVCFLTAALIAPAAFAAPFPASGTPSLQYSADKSFSQRPKPPEQATPMPQKDVDASGQITFDELRAFARDWRKYAKWLKTDGNQYKAVAYLGVSKSSDYPAEVVRWLDARGWAADRFFLLERKFRATLSIMEQETKQTNLQNHLEFQIRQLDENKSLSDNAKKKMRDQYINSIRTVRAATSAKAPVTPEEYELIKLNRDALTRILSD